jgi:hypothetical protein
MVYPGRPGNRHRSSACPSACARVTDTQVSSVLRPPSVCPGFSHIFPVHTKLVSPVCFVLSGFFMADFSQGRSGLNRGVAGHLFTWIADRFARLFLRLAHNFFAFSFYFFIMSAHFITSDNTVSWIKYVITFCALAALFGKLPAPRSAARAKNQNPG